MDWAYRFGSHQLTDGKERKTGKYTKGKDQKVNWTLRNTQA